MTVTTELLVDALGRIREGVHDAVEGLGPRQLAHRVDPEANTIAWLVWHLTRIEDDHLADLAGTPQVWHDGGWFEQFGLPLDRADHGYGHSPEQVASVVAGPQLLMGYQDAVHERAVELVASLGDDDFGRVVDRRWDPPVTLSVRLVSVLNDCAQHVGQAAFVRGVVERGG